MLHKTFMIVFRYIDNNGTKIQTSYDSWLNECSGKGEKNFNFVIPNKTDVHLLIKECYYQSKILWMEKNVNVCY